MRDETYNGWKNRETWATALHINNEQGLQEEVERLVKSAKDKRDLETMLEEYIDSLWDMMIDEGCKELKPMFSDIGSMWRVEWRELAASFWDDFRDEDEDEIDGETEIEL